MNYYIHADIPFSSAHRDGYVAHAVIGIVMFFRDAARWRLYWLALRERGGFELYWKLVQPKLPGVPEGRREALKVKAQDEHDGMRE